MSRDRIAGQGHTSIDVSRVPMSIRRQQIMKDELKQHYDKWTPREQRFFDSSNGFNDPKSGKRYYGTSDRRLATFLVYRKHKVRQFIGDNQGCYTFTMTKRLEESLDAASREDGADLFHVIDMGIGIFVDLLVTEAMQF
jgi:hypothetical protein